MPLSCSLVLVAGTGRACKQGLAKLMFPGFLPDQVDENVMQAGLGEVETTQAYVVGETALQDELRVGLLLDIQLPLSHTWGSPVLHYWQLTRRHDALKLKHWADVVAALQNNAPWNDSAGFLDRAVKHFAPLRNEQQAFAESLGVLHHVGRENHGASLACLVLDQLLQYFLIDRVEP